MMDWNQINGIARAIVPMLLTGLAAIGVMDKSVAETMTEPAVAAVVGIGAAAAAVAAAWSVYKNAPAQTVVSAAAVPGVKVEVGPQAPQAVKTVAHDPTIASVVMK